MILKRIEELGIIIPEKPKPAANYDPATVIGNFIYVSGQLSIKDGKLIYEGKLGDNVSIEAGMSSASLCALNILAVLNGYLDGDLDRIVKCVKLTGYVNSMPDFINQPVVINGASNFMIDVFGDDIGRHARAAVGVNTLPLNATTEVEAIFAFK